MEQGHSAPVTCLVVTRRWGGRVDDEPKIISGCAAGELRVWDLHSGVCEASLPGHTDGVTCLILVDDPDELHEQLLVSSSEDGSVKAWAMGDDDPRFGGAPPMLERPPRAEHALRRSFEGHAEGVTCVDCSYPTRASVRQAAAQLALDAADALLPVNNMQVVSASRDRSLKIWLAGSGECLKTIETQEHLVTCVRIVPAPPVPEYDGMARAKRPHVRPVVATGGADGVLKLWNMGSGVCLATLGMHDPGTAVVELRLLYDAGAALDLRHRDARAMWGEVRQDMDLGRHGQGLLQYETCTLLSAGSDCTARFWCMDEDKPGQMRSLLTCHTQALTALDVWEWSAHAPAFGNREAPEDAFGRAVPPLFVSGAADGAVKVWTMQQGVCKRTLRAHAGGAGGGAGGGAFASDARGVSALCVAQVSRQAAGPGDAHGAHGAAPAAPLLVTAGLDFAIRVWEMDDAVGAGDSSDEELTAAAGDGGDEDDFSELEALWAVPPDSRPPLHFGHAPTCTMNDQPPVSATQDARYLRRSLLVKSAAERAASAQRALAVRRNKEREDRS